MKKIFILITFLVISFSIYAADSVSGKVRVELHGWYVWDSCDTHWWWYESWGGTNPVLSYEKFGTTRCLKVYFSTGPYGYVRTDWDFYPEDWTSLGVTSVNLYVYCIGASNADVRLEVKNSTDGVVLDSTIYDITPNQWNDLSWSISPSTHVAKIFISFRDLPTTPTTFYIDNLRLIRGSTTDYFDSFDGSKEWFYDYDAVPWTSDPSYSDPITHTKYSSISPVCSLIMRWDSAQSQATTAELKTNINENWTGCTKIRANVWCSATNANLDWAFYDGTNWTFTLAKNVSTAETWETIEWDLPTGGNFNWSSVKTVVFRVANTDTVTQGTVYIDDIHLYK